MNNNATVNDGMLKDKIGMAFGSYGLYGAQAFILMYFTIFLTDSMLISANVVGMILLVSRFFDAATDLFMGSLLDRTKTKFGKARPWLLWMVGPAAVSMALMFYVPPFEETGKIVYTIAIYLLVTLCFFTGLALPMQALVSLITTDSKHRLAISQVYGFFQTLGSAVATLASTEAMRFLGGGHKGMFLYFLFLVIVGMGFLLICFKLTKERAHGENKSNTRTAEKVDFKTGAGAVLRNKYWWNFMAIYFMVSLVPTFFIAGTPYYCIYWLDNQVDPGRLGSLLWGGITAGVLLFVPLSRKIGKANSAAVGIGIQALGSLLLWIAPTSVAMVWISTVLRSVGVGGWSGNFTAMLADIVEYGEWKTGVRTEGMIYSGATFGFKLGMGISSSIIGALLAWGQYVPNATVQAAKTMFSLKMIFIGFPFIGSSLITIMLILYGVEKHIPKIKAELADRRKAFS